MSIKTWWTFQSGCRHVFLKDQPKPGMFPGTDRRTFSTKQSLFLDLAVNYFICIPSLKKECTAFMITVTRKSIFQNVLDVLECFTVNNILSCQITE